MLLSFTISRWWVQSNAQVNYGLYRSNLQNALPKLKKNLQNEIPVCLISISFQEILQKNTFIETISLMVAVFISTLVIFHSSTYLF